MSDDGEVVSEQSTTNSHDSLVSAIFTRAFITPYQKLHQSTKSDLNSDKSARRLIGAIKRAFIRIGFVLFLCFLFILGVLLLAVAAKLAGNPSIMKEITLMRVITGISAAGPVLYTGMFTDWLPTAEE